MNKKELITNFKKELIKNEYTLIAYNLSSGEKYFSKERGVKPVLDRFYDKEFFSDAIVVDKVIGKASALLFCCLMPKHIHTFTISKSAKEVFENEKVSFSFEEETKFIINRAKTGMCPMENLTKDIFNPKEGSEKIIEFIKNKG